MEGNSAGWDVRRHTLPSGREVEIVCWSGGEEAVAPHPAPAGPATAPARAHCPRCSSNLTHPTWGEAVNPALWRLELRCAECECHWTDVFAEPEIEAISEAVERGAQALRDDLEALTRENMAAEVERFVAALSADAIVPMDF
jgi:hypothetical protein